MPILDTKEKCTQRYEHYHEPCVRLKFLLQTKHRLSFEKNLSLLIRTLKSDLVNISTDYKSLSSFEELKNIRQVLKPCFQGRMQFYRRCVNDRRSKEDIRHAYARYMYGQAWLQSENIWNKVSNAFKKEPSFSSVSLPASSSSSSSRSVILPPPASKQSTSISKSKSKPKIKSKQKAHRNDKDDFEALKEASVLRAQEELAAELTSISQEDIRGLLQRVDLDIDKQLTFNNDTMSWSMYPGVILNLMRVRSLLLTSRLCVVLINATMTQLVDLSQDKSAHTASKIINFNCDMACYIYERITDDAMSMCIAATKLKFIDKMFEDMQEFARESGYRFHTMTELYTAKLNSVINTFNIAGLMFRFSIHFASVFCDHGVLEAGKSGDYMSGLWYLKSGLESHLETHLYNSAQVERSAMHIIAQTMLFFQYTSNTDQLDEFVDSYAPLSKEIILNILNSQQLLWNIDLPPYERENPFPVTTKQESDWTHVVSLMFRNTSTMYVTCHVSRSENLVLQFHNSYISFVNQAVGIWIPGISTGAFLIRKNGRYPFVYGRTFEDIEKFELSFI